MLPLTENTQETPSPKLTQEFIERILTEASACDLIEIVKYFKDENPQDSESHAGADSLKLSSKTAKELTGFFNNIAKNLELFYRDCQPGHFPTSFNYDIKSAIKRLKSGSDLRPEQRLELQPSAYSGFDDTFSQQNFANILFVMAIANYASNKSQVKIQEDTLIDALKSMDDQSAKQREEISREPRFQAVIPYPNLLFFSTLALNVMVAGIEITLAYEDDADGPNRNYAENLKHHFETKYKNQTDKISSELAKYNLTVPQIDKMTNRHNAIKITGTIGLSEALTRTILDCTDGGLGNSNTKFLLFMTSLFFASEAMAEMISDKNLVKTFFNTDVPTSVDNRLLVDGLRVGLLFASQFDSRFRIERIANNIINSFSSLAIGVVNCVKSLSKSRELDLESGQPLMENITISPDQIKELAKQLTQLLAISTPTPELRASTPTPEVRVSSSASAGGIQPNASTI
jgi:hypothetical protein